MNPDARRRRYVATLLLLPLLALAPSVAAEPPADDVAEEKSPPEIEKLEKGMVSIPLASGTPVLGLDVSHFQDPIDWSAVAATGRFAFAYIKATEGVDAGDPLFARNWQGAAAVGLLRGAYHFYEPADDALEQVRFFLDTVGPLGPGDLPPALDVEVTRDVDAKTILEGAATWLDAVEKATGRRPMIYTGYKFWDELVAGSDRDFGDYPLWLAEYGTSAPQLPQDWSAWTFWQYQDRATVPGIDKEVDLDRYAGTLEDLLKLAGLLGGP